MKIIAFILLLTSSFALAQNISRTELRASNTVVNARISTNATVVNARNAAAEVTNATQTAGITAANVTNAAQTVAIDLANDTNATQTAAITAANATNATQTAAIAALTTHAVSTSNLLAMGITNIIAGANVVITTNSGVLVITGTGSGATNNLPVFGPVTNLLAENLDVDILSVGTFVVTNTIYLTRTNAGSAGNYVADFARAEETIMVGGNITFLHATNLQAGPTNTYICLTLMNFSGSDRTLTIPAAWKESLSFPTVITNATILQLALKNYGGLSQTNVLAGAAQF